MKDQKIDYRFNPYTFARVYAMKGLLLKKQDYDKIMKMDPSEIIKFLQEGVYNEDINAMAMKYSGIRLIEIALNKSLAKSFLKLRQIADENIRALMDEYLKRYDIWNIKNILRARLVNSKEEELDELLFPVGSLKLKKLKEMFKKNSTKEIIEEAKLISIDGMKDAIERYDASKDLSEIENLLDYNYYSSTLSFSRKLPKKGKLLSDFFVYEIEIYNLKLILKKIFFKLDKNNIEKFLIYQGRNLSEPFLKNLLQLDSILPFIREIKKTQYRRIFESEKDDISDPLLKYDVLFEEFLLKKRLLLFHQHPLTVDVILGFMFIKEIEVKNLKIIIKSKKLEINEDYIKKMIIIEN